MNHSNSSSVLVIGDGLAGTLVGWELSRRNISFEIWSDGKPGASSVAAGMFNPVSFRRILPQWDAEVQLTAARYFYEELEGNLGVKLWNEVPILRVFPDERYAKLWAERAAGGHDVSPFIECLSSAEIHPSVKAPYGAGLVRRAGWVDVKSLTEKSRRVWQQAGKWSQKSWSLDDGCPAEFSHVVDCRGTGAVGDLARFGIELRRNHGEVITIHIEEDWGDQTVNNVTWALPLGEGAYKIGSTYRWDMDRPDCLENTPGELLASVHRVRHNPAVDASSITEHQAGLRPSCFDRRPVLGRISDEHEWYVCCTGFGTRGVVVGPTAVKWTVAAMLNEIASVPAEVNPKRFRTFTKN